MSGRDERDPFERMVDAVLSYRPKKERKFQYRAKKKKKAKRSKKK